jgi:hypothetical protein
VNASLVGRVATAAFESAKKTATITDSAKSMAFVDASEAGRVRHVTNPIAHQIAMELVSAFSLGSVIALNHSTVLLAQTDAAHTLALVNAITRVCVTTEFVSARLDGQERIAAFPLALLAAPVRDNALFPVSANAM